MNQFKLKKIHDPVLKLAGKSHQLVVKPAWKVVELTENILVTLLSLDILLDNFILFGFYAI